MMTLMYYYNRRILSLQTTAQAQEADEPIVGTLEKYHNQRGRNRATAGKRVRSETEDSETVQRVDFEAGRTVMNSDVSASRARDVNRKIQFSSVFSGSPTRIDRDSPQRHQS